MNVASLELCKELYKVSGWDDTAFAFTHGKMFYQQELKYQAALVGFTPAYDLGFLLRKLPDELASGFGISLRMNVARTKWLCGYHKHDDAVADNPEDAVAQLAIELFNQRILQKEEGRS